MAINLVVNGITYRYPQEGDVNWGQVTTLWAQAVTNGMLQRAGGSFPLTADVDFGGNFGLLSPYFTARTANPAQTGAIRLAASSSISYRNTANTQDLSLSIDSNDDLLFNGNLLLNSSYSGIMDANIATNAAIQVSKLQALTANRAVQSDSNGFLEASSVTNAELSYLSGVSSSVQDQLNSKLNLSGGTMSGTLILASNPTLTLQAATKQYVDNAMLGISPKTSCVAATTGPGNLATDFEDGDTLDGVLLSTGDRILIKDQASPAENGIYIVQASGSPLRSSDMDTWIETVQAYTLITQGTTNIGSGWLSSTSPGGTLGTTPIDFLQFSSTTQYTADGEGIELSGTTFSLELDGTTLTKSASGLRVNSTIIADLNSKLTNPMTTNGDLISRSGGSPSRIGIGTTGQLLTVVAGAPAWQTFNLNPTVVTATSNVTLTASDSNKVYLMDSSVGALNIQLPAPQSGLQFFIKDKAGQAATNIISILRNSTEQIEGVAATKILQTNWGSWRIISDGTNWFIL